MGKRSKVHVRSDDAFVHFRTWISIVAFSQDSAACLAKAMWEMYVRRANWLAGGEIASQAVAEKYSIEGMIETFTTFFKGQRSPV